MLTEEAINAAHKARWAEAAEKYGGQFQVPKELVREMGEQHRLDWVAFTESRERGGESKGRRDKTARMHQFVRENIGNSVSPSDLAEHAEASLGTAYQFINDNRSLFRKEGAGQYVVVDAERERADAKRPTRAPALPSERSDSDSTATSEASTANAILAAMTGEDEQRVVGKW